MEDGLDTLGADEVGVDYGGILQAAGGLATAGVSAAEQAKKEKEATADEEKKAAAAIAADQAAAAAMARADVSTGTPSAAIDTQAMQMAIANEDRAAAGLTANAQKKRADAADATLAAVVKVAQGKPTDKNQAALVKAWTTVAAKAHSGAIASTGAPGSGLVPGGESWFTRRVLGPVPGYGVLLIGAGALGAGWLVVKKFVLSKVG